MPRFVLFLVLLAAAVGCRPRPLADTATSAPAVWMAQTYSGGQQCAPRQPYTPPNVAEVMARERIAVLAMAVEQMSVCQACTCPAYAARHFVQIRAADAERAAALGFEPAEAPPEGARRSG